MKPEMCPFCPLMCPLEDEWEPVGYTFNGEPAMIGDVRACAGCATVAEISNGAAAMLAELEEARKSQASA